MSKNILSEHIWKVGSKNSKRNWAISNDNDLSTLLEQHECCNQAQIEELQKMVDSLRETIYSVFLLSESLMQDTSVTMQSPPENHAMKILRDYIITNVNLNDDQK